MNTRRLLVATAAACLSILATGAQAFTIEASMARVQSVPDGSRYVAENTVASAPERATFASHECKPDASGANVVCIYHDPSNGNLVCRAIGECESYADLNAAAGAYVALRR